MSPTCIDCDAPLVDWTCPNGCQVPKTETITMANPEVCGAYVHTDLSREYGSCRCGQPGVTTTRQERDGEDPKPPLRHADED